MISAEPELWVINYIRTSDPRFKTNEALQVGDTAARTLEVSGVEVTKVNNYVFTVRLPWGWNAEFLQAD